MSIRRRIRRSPLVAEAAFALARAFLRVRFQPFASVAAHLSRPVAVRRADPLAAAQDVRGLMGAVCSRLPRRPTCLLRAVAAHAMLARRGVPSTVVLSIAPEEERAADLRAHAWLEAAGMVVTGRSEMKRFTPIHRIGNEPVWPAEGAPHCSR